MTVELVSKPFILTPTACIVEGKPTYEQWAEALQRLQGVHRSVAWWIGDLLNYGERVYGETYTQAVEVTGLAVQTLMNYKWLAKAIPPEKRVEDLSLRAHLFIAREPEREREALLSYARERIARGEGVSTEDIRLWKENLLRVRDSDDINFGVVTWADSDGLQLQAMGGTEAVVVVHLTELEAWALLDNVGGPDWERARQKIREALLEL